MALISVLIGGFGGFASFLAAWLVLDFSFLSAFGLYVGMGTLMAITVIALAYATAPRGRAPAMSEAAA